MLKKWMNSQYFMPGILAGVGLIGFIIVSICVVFNVFQGFDSYAVSYLHQFSVKYYTNIEIFFSQMGHDYAMIYLFFIILAVFLFKRFYKDGLLIAVSVQSAFFFNLLFKNIFQRPRPPVEFHILEANDWSYPSGHTLKSVCLYGILIYMCLKYIKNPLLKYALITLMAVLVVMIGFSRVYLGDHFPTDVFGGFFLGLFLVNFWIMVDKATTDKQDI